MTRLALRARDGDRAALAAFVSRTQAEVWRLCRHLGGSEEADDLTQETYARALRSLPRFRAEASARTWLLLIARRTAADAVRRAVRARRHPANPPEPVVDHAGAVALDARLDELDDERRAAFVLTQLLGLSYAEAAEVCSVPVGTIRSRVARAREQLLVTLRRRRRPRHGGLVMRPGYRRGMRGHRTGRIALAVALVALPLAGLSFLLGDDAAPDLPAVPREALARLAPGQAGDALAVRPATDAEPPGRAAGVRNLTLLAVLAAAGGALVLLPAGRRAPLLSAPVPAGRHRSPRGRGPPSRFPC